MNQPINPDAKQPDPAITVLEKERNSLKECYEGLNAQQAMLDAGLEEAKREHLERTAELKPEIIAVKVKLEAMEAAILHLGRK